MAGHTSTRNSTTATLAPGASFTGGAELVAAYRSVSVECFSGGNASTLYIYMGKTENCFGPLRTIPIAAGETYYERLPLEGAFIRARLANGPGAISSPRLLLIFHEDWRPAPPEGSGVHEAPHDEDMAITQPSLGEAVVASISLAECDMPIVINQPYQIINHVVWASPRAGGQRWW